MGVGELDETTAPYLAGYRGMGPVRMGNAAYKQIQHDCYGQIVLRPPRASSTTPAPHRER